MLSTPSSEQGTPNKALYSPICVPESPLSSPGQLTGIPRRVRDSSAGLFNSIQEWNRLHIDGMQVILLIKEMKLNELEKKKEQRLIYPEGLEALIKNLEELCVKLKAVENKIATVFKNLEAIKKLQEMKGITRPIFISWSDDKYVSVAGTIATAYCKEFLLKNFIMENIAHIFSKEDIMLFCALWAHQPYIDKECDILLESMLKETGHR